MSVKELLEELEAHTERFREELSHLVTWQSFERAGAVVTELETDLERLGVPVAPLETLTQSVLAVAQAVHDHVTAGQAEQHRESIEAEIAALQAKLPGGPAGPAPITDPADLFKQPPADPEGQS